jgi:uncharacterized protein (DUF2267 family)
MRYEDFVERVMQLGGFTRREEAVRAVGATLAVLRARLIDEDVEAMAAGLPALIARLLRYGEYEGEFGREEFFDRVRRREGVMLGYAREHAEVVCRVLAEAVAQASLKRLRKHLPDDLATLFEEPAPPAPAPSRERIRRGNSGTTRRRTLAEGRAGSEHPVSESRPAKAQSHSVVREDNPHGDTKIASARGVTQERESESLAEGRPPRPKRTLSES